LLDRCIDEKELANENSETARVTASNEASPSASPSAATYVSVAGQTGQFMQPVLHL
jgi:hypothetical protein